MPGKIRNYDVSNRGVKTLLSFFNYPSGAWWPRRRWGSPPRSNPGPRGGGAPGKTKRNKSYLSKFRKSYWIFDKKYVLRNARRNLHWNDNVILVAISFKLLEDGETRKKCKWKIFEQYRWIPFRISFWHLTKKGNNKKSPSFIVQLS